MLLLALAAATPVFDPLRFFAGHTEGRGRLRIVLHPPREVRVHGTGRPGPGGLVLTQSVEQQGKPVATRAWVLREVTPGRWAGTLTDAAGPVSAQASGNRLHIAYRTRGKVRVEQWLTLAADGRSARNQLTARRLGIVVARLDETIIKTD